MKPPDYETERLRSAPRYCLYFCERGYSGADEDWEEHRDWPGIPRVGDLVVLGPTMDPKWPRRRRVLDVCWQDKSSSDGTAILCNLVEVEVVLSAELQ